MPGFKAHCCQYVKTLRLFHNYDHNRFFTNMTILGKNIFTNLSKVFYCYDPLVHTDRCDFPPMCPYWIFTNVSRTPIHRWARGRPSGGGGSGKFWPGGGVVFEPPGGVKRFDLQGGGGDEGGNFPFGQCDQKIFFQIADERCQNRQKIANNFRKLFKIARISGQNRRSNPAFFVFYCIFITNFSSRPQNIFIFPKKVKKFLALIKRTRTVFIRSGTRQ